MRTESCLFGILSLLLIKTAILRIIRSGILKMLVIHVIEGTNMIYIRLQLRN